MLVGVPAGPGKPSGLHYQENVIVDLGGFILSRGVTHASEGEWKAVPDLLEGLPLQPISLAGDTGYNVGKLRQLLEERDIAAYIPIHPIQETSMVSRGGFVYHGDRLVCPQGKILRQGLRSTVGNGAYQYCRTSKRLPGVSQSRTPVSHRDKNAATSACHDVSPRVYSEGPGTQPDRRVPSGNDFRRRTIAEGTFASLGSVGMGQIPVAGALEGGP